MSEIAIETVSIEVFIWEFFSDLRTTSVKQWIFRPFNKKNVSQKYTFKRFKFCFLFILYNEFTDDFLAINISEIWENEYFNQSFEKWLW